MLSRVIAILVQLEIKMGGSGNGWASTEFILFWPLKMSCLGRNLGPADSVAGKKMQALDESAFNSKIVLWKSWTSRFIYEKTEVQKGEVFSKFLNLGTVDILD